jgi:lipopolysaccharide biosynthesis regulator YciM
MHKRLRQIQPLKQQIQQLSSNNPNDIEGLKNKLKPIRNIESLAKLATAYQEASDWTNAIDTWKKISVYYRIGLHLIIARLMPVCKR